MNAISFFIPGKIQPKERPRVFKTKAGKSMSMTPENTVIYENLVKTCYMKAANGFVFPDTELEMEIIAVFPLMQSYSGIQKKRMSADEIRPIKKPDCDNIAKAICDGLNLVAYHDDSQIVNLQIVKRYENDNFLPGAYVTIRERE